MLNLQKFGSACMVAKVNNKNVRLFKLYKAWTC